MKHIVEVDQSIKIEQAGNTVLAFANGISHAVVIPSHVKRGALDVLWKKGKSRKLAPIILFFACLYSLLEDYLPNLQKVIIDEEYTGQDANIRFFLLAHIRNDKKHFEPRNILFDRVGKSSPADKKARAVRTGKDNQYRKITLKNVMRLVK